MPALHQKLHLQHVGHTGKLLHHRHTSYRGLALVLVLAGFTMLGMSYVQHTAADELFSVGASVHVPVPHAAPTIAQPANNQTLTNGHITISGSCPLVSPQAVIAVAVDGSTVGSAACNASNDFAFAATLGDGAHTIVATAYTLDRDHGPASVPLQLTVQASPASVATDTLGASTLFTTVSTNKNVNWNGTVSGTAKSYRLLLEWGDGNYDSYTVKPGAVSVHHQYAQLAAYNITVGLRDASGNYTYVQTAAANGDTSGALAAAFTQPSQQNMLNTHTVIGLYGLFITLVAVAGIVRLHAVPFAYTQLTLHHHGHA